jgi:hypothetical protein
MESKIAQNIKENKKEEGGVDNFHADQTKTVDKEAYYRL